MEDAYMHDFYVYVGTYTKPIKFGTGEILDGKGKGIYRLRFNVQTGRLSREGNVADAVNPSYLTLDHSGRYLYAVNELKEYQGRATGSVSAYGVDPETHELNYINTRPTGGADPCHVTVNKENTHVFVCNFMSGSICVFPIMTDGSLGEASDFIQHTGSSVNKLRQASPHAHSLVFDGSGHMAFVPDLGIDKLMIYRTDPAKGRLIPNEIPWFSVRPGAGPRHCVFHNSGKYCYLINELNSTILTLFYNAEKGTFKQIQEVPSVAVPFDGQNICADIHISPGGKFLYGSNRGHDSIVTYSIDQKSGLLSYVDTIPCGGKTPRNFAVDPTGNYILVCNQDTDNIVVFRIEQETGKLIKVFDCPMPTPVCVKIYR